MWYCFRAGRIPATGPKFSFTSLPDFTYSLPDRRTKDQSSGNGILGYVEIESIELALCLSLFQSQFGLRMKWHNAYIHGRLVLDSYHSMVWILGVKVATRQPVFIIIIEVFF